ncbi:MAG: cyclic nucleotide-binding domain-containing protein [Spirochaetales bacterium]|nr:cyclic nucleotide-binding domain-containing protein [Spirochaetales bacterium]
MSPKAVFYKANSIIYFRGDIADKVFILNSGKISLNYEDIETGQELHDLVKTGEFLGVKSALGRFGREETALVLTDSNVVAFSVEEFEALVLKNIPLILKMLKVFSNQLRRIHKQVQTLLSAEEHVNPEKGLYSIGDYYLKKKAYDQAIYAFKRYLVYYPSGSMATEALKNIEVAESFRKQYGSGKGPELTPKPQQQAQPENLMSDKPTGTKAISDSGQQFYRAVSLISQDKYEEAFKAFKKIAAETDDQEYISKSQYEMGRCLFYLKQFDKSISLFTDWIQKFPKHPDVKDALFFVGSCQMKMGNNAKAAGFFKKVLTMTPESESLYQKAKKMMRQVEGAT